MPRERRRRTRGHRTRPGTYGPGADPSEGPHSDHGHALQPPIVQNDSVTNCLDRESELSIKKIDQSISISKSKKIIDTSSKKETKKEFNEELEEAADEKEFENLKKSIDKKIN